MTNVLKSQVTVAVGDQLTSGMSIKDILEKVNLFSIIEDDDVKKGGKSGKGTTTLDPESAYLGPKFWDKPISLDAIGVDDEDTPTEDLTAEVMNIDDFLFENSLNLNSEENDDSITFSLSEIDIGKKAPKRSLSESEDKPEIIGKKKKLKILEENSSFLYAESKRVRMEREAAEKKRREAEELDIVFAPEDLSLATVPGTTFNPRERAFSSDELKPQPIIRKRKKEYIPTDRKDDRYWDKRIKNNVAARRSREARRLKENQIALRAAFLEKENKSLKFQLESAEEENQSLTDTVSFLKQKLQAYEQA